MLRRRAGPKHAVLLLDLLIGDAGVIGDATLGGQAQLIENLAWVVEGEASLTAQRPSDILDDPPVFARRARAVNGFVDLDDAALGRRHRALVFLMQRAGQDHIGEAGRLAQEEVDHHIEFQLFQHALHKPIVRQRHHRVETDAEQAFDLAPVDLAKDLVRVYARPRQIIWADAPDLGDIGAVLGFGDVARAGELITLLTLLTPALAVALAGDGGIAAVLAAQAARGQHQVDGAEHILHAVTVMLDAAGVHEKAGLGRPPPFRGLADGSLGNAGDLGRAG